MTEIVQQEGWSVVHVTIANQRGLHARAAAKFVKVASLFESEILVEKNGQQVDGNSIMDLMMLVASIGTRISIFARGADAMAATEALRELVEGKFDEGE